MFKNIQKTILLNYHTIHTMCLPEVEGIQFVHRDKIILHSIGTCIVVNFPCQHKVCSYSNFKMEQYSYELNSTVMTGASMVTSHTLKLQYSKCT